MTPPMDLPGRDDSWPDQANEMPGIEDDQNPVLDKLYDSTPRPGRSRIPGDATTALMVASPLVVGPLVWWQSADEPTVPRVLLALLVALLSTGAVRLLSPDWPLVVLAVVALALFPSGGGAAATLLCLMYLLAQQVRKPRGHL